MRGFPNNSIDSPPPLLGMPFFSVSAGIDRGTSGRAGASGIALNGIEAISEHGALWISTASRTDRVEITIRDNGEGIREDHLQRVFDPYFTTKSSGSGLGLPLSKMIVEVLRMILEKEGHTVETAGSGNEGLSDQDITL